MKLTNKYNQIIKGSRKAEYNRLIELYGTEAINNEFNGKGLKPENLYYLMRRTVTYPVILEYMDSRYGKK